MRLIDADALFSEVKARHDLFIDSEYIGDKARRDELGIFMADIVNAPTIGCWIPFVKRQLTDDEKNTHPDWCYILEGNVPEDGEEILLYRPWKNSKGYIITMDQYMNNGTECYLDGAGDIENGMFWMPLPEPPKEDE